LVHGDMLILLGEVSNVILMICERL
jgi:hypothetical protein